MASVRRYKTINDTRNALAAFLRMLEKGEIDVQLGRALISGCATMANIQRDSDMETRLEALETQQGHRKAA